MPFLSTFWREAIIGALCLALAGVGNLWLSARDDLAICKTQHENAVNAALAETAKAEIISKKAIGELNASIPKLVAQAQANAAENYRRRFADLPRDNRAGGIRSDVSTGLQPSTDPTSAVQAGSTESVAGEPDRLHVDQACDPRFLADVAEAAVKLDGWEKWRVSNGLEYE